MNLNGNTLIEPLCKATGNVLKPLNLLDSDYLQIGISDDRKAFVVEGMRGRAVDVLQYHELSAEEKQRVHVTCDGGRVLQLSGGVSWRLESWLTHGFPESDGRPYSYRRIACTDYSVLLIHHRFPRERMIFKSDEARTRYEYLLLRFMLQNERAKTQAEFKLNGTVPEMPADFVDSESLPLSGYQKTAVSMGLQQEATALFMRPGTGKTAVCIKRVDIEAKRQRAGKLANGEERMYRVLVVCPRQVRLNWQIEFSRFATTPGKVTVMRGAKMRRMNLLTQAMMDSEECAFTAVVVSYDTLAQDISLYEACDWDLVISDESHYFKSTSTKRWAAMKRLRDNSDKRMILTGTPIANTLFDIYSQLEFLAEGMSGFSNFKAFRNFHAQFEERGQTATGGSYQAIANYINIPLFQERLARLSFSITAEEAGLELPDMVYDVVEVEMTSKQAEIYKTLKEELSVEIENAISTGGNNSVTVNHVLTQLLRLAQITSGYVKYDNVEDEYGNVIQEGATSQIDAKNPKVEAIIDLLQDPEKDPNEKTIIWACWREDIRILRTRLQQEGIPHVVYFGDTSEAGREIAINAFNNDPRCKVFIGNPASAGEGLNLLGYNHNDSAQALPGSDDTYCGHEIFMSQGWSYIQRDQAEARAHRRGTKMPVRVTDLTVPGTIDEEIRKRVQLKGSVASSLQDIQSILQNVLQMEVGV